MFAGNEMFCPECRYRLGEVTPKLWEEQRQIKCGRCKSKIRLEGTPQWLIRSGAKRKGTIYRMIVEAAHSDSDTLANWIGHLKKVE